MPVLVKDTEGTERMCVRVSGRWKLHFARRGSRPWTSVRIPEELYHLEKDIAEKHNVANISHTELHHLEDCRRSVTNRRRNVDLS